jgi:hypothetical protein
LQGFLGICAGGENRKVCGFGWWEIFPEGGGDLLRGWILGYRIGGMEVTDKTSAGQTEAESTKKGRGGWQGSEKSKKNLVQYREKEPEPVEEEDGELDLLGAMRHVVRCGGSKDKTPLQKDCRKWKNQDIKGFMTKLAELEREKPGEAVEEEGPEACEELVEQMLREWEESEESK